MKAFSLCLLSLLMSQILLAQQTGDIYGVNFTTGTLKLASVNPNNGIVEIINEEPLSGDQFTSGNSDMNPNEGLYHYVRNGQIITADIITGEVIYDPELTCTTQDINPIVPISNIAYNFIDSTIYGLVHFDQSLSFAMVDPLTGIITIISDGPISSDNYSSGVSDIDPYGGRYFYIRDNRIVTVLISTGEVDQNHSIENPNNAIAPITNIAYDWLSGQIYGLNFVGGFWDNQGNEVTPAELRLATVNPSNGDLTILSDNTLSSDQFSSGVSDLDPLNRVYYYIRANSIYTVDLLTGDLIQSSSLSNPNNAIQPITNIGVYKDQFSLPSAISDFQERHMGLEVQFKNISAYSYNAHWNFGDGKESFQRHPLNVFDEPGMYEVTLISENLEGESDTITRTITVEGTVVGFEDISDLEFRLFPNPADNFVIVKSTANLQGFILTIYDTGGQMIRQKLLSEATDNNLEISGLASGVYFVKLESLDKKNRLFERLIVR